MKILVFLIFLSFMGCTREQYYKKTTISASSGGETVYQLEKIRPLN